MGRLLRLSGTNFTTSGLPTIKNPDLYNDIDFVNFYNIISVAGTVTDAHYEALATFIANTKADNDWSKYGLFMPMIGNSLATSLVFLRPSNGTSSTATVTGTNPTYSTTTGLTGSGSGFVDTGLLASNYASTGVGGALGIYPVAAVSATLANAIGLGATTSTASLFAISANAANSTIAMQFSFVNTSVNPSATGTSSVKKVIIASRVGTTSHKLYRDGSTVGTSTDATQLGTFPTGKNIKLFPLASNDTSTTGNCTHTLGCAFVFNTPLSDADVARISPRIQTLMTALGRI